ncbi:MAG: EpsG family protein [Bacteroidales bacterium]|nr:EpsG family protein [Bacteroidales bacterium]
MQVDTQYTGKYYLKSKAVRGNRLYYYLGFLFWPFGLMLASFRYRHKPWAKNIFWLFCIYFGFVFIISSEGPDSARYANTLIELSKSDLTFSNLISALYTTETNYVDIVQPLITFIVSRFTTNYHVLFAVFAFIFGFFYSRNLWFLLERINGKITIVCFIFILTFALIISVWNINGFRMWTAAQIYLYGMLPFLIEGDKKKLFWTFFSVFVHFSFFFPVAVVFLYLLAGDRLTVYFWFFIIASFITEINIESVKEFISSLPDVFRLKLIGYTSEEYTERVKSASESLNWYVPYSSAGVRGVVYAFSIAAFIKCRNLLKSEKGLLNLFSFSLLFYGFANIARNIPSGGRFITVANLFMFAFIVFILLKTNRNKIFTLLKYLSIPALLLFLIVAIRIGFDYMGIMTFIGNPFTAIFYEDTVPLIFYVKKLLMAI